MVTAPVPDPRREDAFVPSAARLCPAAGSSPRAAALAPHLHGRPRGQAASPLEDRLNFLECT